MLDALGAVAIWGGFFLVLVGFVCFLVAAFRESILWGLGILFLPLVWLVFLVLEWPVAKRPFFLQLYGVILVLVGVFALSAPIPFLHTHH
jgi:hypothetical protein